MTTGSSSHSVLELTQPEARDALAVSCPLVSLLDDDMLLDDLAEIERAQRQLDAALTRILIETDTRGVCDRELGLDTGAFAARESHRSIGAMRTRVERSKVLYQWFPVFAVALDRYDISWAHAASPRVVELLAGCERELVRAAIELPFKRYRQLVQETVALLDQDGLPPRTAEDSELFITPLYDGTYHVHGVLCGDLGAAIAELVQAETRRTRDRYRNDREHSGEEINIPRAPALRAIALHDALLRAATAAAPLASTVTDLTLTAELVDDHRYGAADVGAADSASLQSRLNQSVFRCLDGTRLRGSQLESRLCDAAWSFLAIDPTGLPLAVGHTHRFATPAQRRAARRRDGGCVFPGCDQPAHATELHHVWAFGNGGPTDIDNLASLCRHHHGISHRTGWSMTTTHDQWFT